MIFCTLVWLQCRMLKLALLETNHSQNYGSKLKAYFHMADTDLKYLKVVSKYNFKFLDFAILRFTQYLD